MIVFPALAGLKYGSKKTPAFKTQIKQSVNGYENRAALMAYPLWHFSLAFEFLRDDSTFNELKTLAGFYLQNKGAYDTWLFTDPTDNTVADQAFGVGDGSSTAYQLVRDIGGFTDIVQAPNSITVYIDGVSTTAYTQSNGLITFNSAPANGAILRWSGTFYFPCRFKDDQMDFENFMYQLWEAKKVEFQSVKL